MVACASSGKSQTLNPVPRVSQMTTTSKGYVSFLGTTLPVSKQNLFMTSHSSLKKQQSRRVLKRSNALSFREMTHGSSTRGLLLCDVLGTYPDFSERMSQVASTGGSDSRAGLPWGANHTKDARS